MKLSLLYCTQTKNKQELTEKYGKFNILNSERLDEVDVYSKIENKKTLPTVYSAWIKKNDGITVLTHDDLLIKDKFWLEKLNKALEKYDVVGLAGGSKVVIKPPCLWHLMCPKETYRGSVAHVAPNGRDTFMTNFGEQGRVLILDGIFLAFNSKKIREAGANFDTTNPCIAHFYDIDFSLTCNKLKLKLGTVNIDTVHYSPGLKKYTDEWYAGQSWFMQKYLDGKY
jgi:hypothetical protein